MPLLEREAVNDPVDAMQAEFAAALLVANGNPPGAVVAATPQQLVKRFAVYRNNVNASLSAALAARFPVVARLVGSEFFRATALVFIERQPPRSPVLAEYGGEFAEFLARFEPVRQLPYLPDVARLEWLRSLAYHATDVVPLEVASLLRLPPEKLEDVHLRLHPSVGFIMSDYPVVSIWTTNTYDDEVKPLPVGISREAALVTRPDQEVLVTGLPLGVAEFMAALASGSPLGEATRAGMASTSNFELAKALALIFGAGAVAALA